MVDRKGRDTLIELTRRLFVGRLNTRAYEELCWRHIDFCGGDEALWHTHMRVVFHWIDEPRARRVRFRDLMRKERREIARCILFLQSDRPLEWDESGRPLAEWWQAVLYLFSFGKRGESPAPKPRGDRRVYPFFRQADFNAARLRPRLLAG